MAFLTREELDAFLPRHATRTCIDDSPAELAAFAARSQLRNHIDTPRMSPYSEDAEEHGVKRP